MIPYPCGHPRTDANTIVRERYDRPVGTQRRCKICYFKRKRERHRLREERWMEALKASVLSIPKENTQ